MHCLKNIIKIFALLGFGGLSSYYQAAFGEEHAKGNHIATSKSSHSRHDTPKIDSHDRRKTHRGHEDEHEHEQKARGLEEDHHVHEQDTHRDDSGHHENDPHGHDKVRDAPENSAHDPHKIHQGHSKTEDKKHDDHGEEHDDSHSSHKHEDEHGDDEGHGGKRGHDDHEGEAQFGENKAITAVEEGGERFKLAQRSVELLGIRTATLKKIKHGTFQIPKSALIRYREEYGVYVVREGWIQLVQVALKDTRKDQVFLSSNRLKSNETIVVSGTGFVRAAHLQASGKGGKGHVH